MSASKQPCDLGFILYLKYAHHVIPCYLVYQERSRRYFPLDGDHKDSDYLGIVTKFRF